MKRDAFHTLLAKFGWLPHVRYRTHIISRRISGHQSHSKSIRTILINDLQRIDTISQRFAHLATQGVPYQTVDKYGVERTFSGVFIAGEYHTDNPEKMIS